MNKMWQNKSEDKKYYLYRKNSDLFCYGLFFHHINKIKKKMYFRRVNKSARAYVRYILINRLQK